MKPTITPQWSHPAAITSPYPALPYPARLSSESLTNERAVVMITGGSAGLGLAIAEVFAKAGYRIAIVGRSVERLETASQFLRESCGADVERLVADVTSESDCRRLAEQIEQTYGRLNALVNCVGTSDRGLADELTPQRVRELIDQNVTSSLLCCQAMRPLLESSQGSAVNIGSLAGKVGAKYLGGYVLAKHALSGLTQQLRLEWRDRGIHVGLVSPGPIRRNDAGDRYSARTANSSVPQEASAPGGGTKVKGLAPEKVANAVLACVRHRKPDVILPGHLRFLIVIGNAFPRLGDWLLLRFTR